MTGQALVVMRGLPGCGKTRTARGWVAEDPQHRCRISRDDTRTSYHGGWLGEAWQEDMVTTGEHAEIGALLDAGISVVVDDTHLNPGHLAATVQLAMSRGIAAEVHDMTDVPLQVCIDRDAARPDAERIGEQVIRRMYARWLDGPTARQVADGQGWLTPRTIADLNEPTPHS